ncbi:cytochrome o ubiquinol oxidase subunit IV [Cupriavidus necator]|uniref:cytochrome o ubiquinol oxidase subunit IV n=1 Tax=Cupriavidus necator TaxID=106590 RepID=UPI0006919829|nr:cytochrome o ubiquinol oxidase subunit IV [Cupriavidus necator]
MSNPNLHAVGAASASHGSLKGYLSGFVLSLVLTFASFGAVMSGRLPPGKVLVGIVVLCVAQLIVQLVFFLHLGTSRDQRENTAILFCCGLLLAIIVAGSLWVMHNANENMMPTNMTVDRAKVRD